VYKKSLYHPHTPYIVAREKRKECRGTQEHKSKGDVTPKRNNTEMKFLSKEINMEHFNNITSQRFVTDKVGK